jgi:hypothetical protein
MNEPACKPKREWVGRIGEEGCVAFFLTSCGGLSQNGPTAAAVKIARMAL